MNELAVVSDVRVSGCARVPVFLFAGASRLHRKLTAQYPADVAIDFQAKTHPWFRRCGKWGLVSIAHLPIFPE